MTFFEIGNYSKQWRPAIASRRIRIRPVLKQKLHNGYGVLNSRKIQRRPAIFAFRIHVDAGFDQSFRRRRIVAHCRVMQRRHRACVFRHYTLPGAMPRLQ